MYMYIYIYIDRYSRALFLVQLAIYFWVSLLIILGLFFWYSRCVCVCARACMHTQIQTPAYQYVCARYYYSFTT